MSSPSLDVIGNGGREYGILDKFGRDEFICRPSVFLNVKCVILSTYKGDATHVGSAVGGFEAVYPSPTVDITRQFFFFEWSAIRLVEIIHVRPRIGLVFRIADRICGQICASGEFDAQFLVGDFGRFLDDRTIWEVQCDTRNGIGK